MADKSDQPNQPKTELEDFHPVVTRCKFACTSVNKFVNNNSNRDTVPFVYSAKFQVVYGNSPENAKFFASTPSGSVELNTYSADLFVPGQEYFLDFIKA